jgi:hypothetical protein
MAAGATWDNFLAGWSHTSEHCKVVLMAAGLQCKVANDHIKRAWDSPDKEITREGVRGHGKASLSSGLGSRFTYLMVHRTCYVNGQLGGLSCSTITPLRDNVRHADASQVLVKYESSSLLGNMRQVGGCGWMAPLPLMALPILHPGAPTHPAAAPLGGVLPAALILQFEQLPCH